MEQRIAEEAKVKYDSPGAKILLTLMTLSAVGTIACVILAVLRIALEGAVITAGILMALGLVCVVFANGMKYKFEARLYKMELDAQQQKAFDS